jgi:DNA-binding winged helix-turn-helix (wHTH) protein
MKVFSPFRLDAQNQCLWKTNGVGRQESVQLAPKAFAVLAYLVEHAGCLVKHDELLKAGWNDVPVEPQAVRKHVLMVRRALGDRAENPLFIKTVSKMGYQFIAPVSELTSDKELLDLIYALEHHHTNPEGIYWIGQTLVECRSLLRGRGLTAPIPLVDELLSDIDSDARSREGPMFGVFVSPRKLAALVEELSNLAGSVDGGAPRTATK